NFLRNSAHAFVTSGALRIAEMTKRVSRPPSERCRDFPDGCRRWRTMELLLQQLFRDLHRVERRAFEQLIAADPETQAVVQRAIFANAADFAIIFFRSE